ncbi:MAG: DUF2089 family protein [Phycisphaerae bacterium]
MAIPANIRCPACGGGLVPVELKCGACQLTVAGEFVTNEFAALGEEELHFLRIFVHCEGRIREMEAALGVSYPTIKNRMARLKEVLSGAAGGRRGVVAGAGEGGVEGGVEGRSGSKGGDLEVLAELEAGRISFEEAKARLKRASAGEES